MNHRRNVTAKAKHVLVLSQADHSCRFVVPVPQQNLVTNSDFLASAIMCNFDEIVVTVVVPLTFGILGVFG